MAEDPFASLPADLPEGRVVHAAPGHRRGTSIPALWLSDERPEDADLWWARLYATRGETGLYPLLLDTLENSPGDRPWRDTCDLTRMPVAAIDHLNAETVLRGWWGEDTEANGEIYGTDSVLARPWPGMAPPGTPEEDPDLVAETMASAVVAYGPRLLGLAPVERGADALTATGWQGPLNHTNHTQEISTVVRSWEERFGARVVSVGFDTLGMAVAAPPASLEHARAVAVEHYAFCPDNVDQGEGDFDLYAESLVGTAWWAFWWD